MNQTLTNEQVQAIRALLLTVLDCIKARGRMGLPAGDLYAIMLESWPNLTANTFNSMIAALVATGQIRRSNHLLTWVG